MQGREKTLNIDQETAHFLDFVNLPMLEERSIGKTEKTRMDQVIIYLNYISREDNEMIIVTLAGSTHV